MYHAAPCNAAYSPTLRVAEGQTELVFEIKPAFFHAAGAAHGSVIFKALDDAAFFASISLVDRFVLTASFTVHFLRPIASGRLRAEGRVVAQTRTQILAEAVAYDERNRQIGRGSGAFAKTDTLLDETLGYR